MSVKVKDFEVTDYLHTEAEMVAYLNAIAEEGDTGLLLAALGDVAKARGMSQVARKTGLGRESLYKSLNEDGNPSFDSVRKIAAALGTKIVFEPALTAA